jgi:hypothetical protein
LEVPERDEHGDWPASLLQDDRLTVPLESGDHLAQRLAELEGIHAFHDI